MIDSHEQDTTQRPSATHAAQGVVCGTLKEALQFKEVNGWHKLPMHAFVNYLMYTALLVLIT